MSLQGGFAAVTIVIQQLLASFDVPRGDEDEVRHAINVVEFGLAVTTLAVIDQSPETICFSSGIHTGMAVRVRGKRKE